MIQAFEKHYGVWANLSEFRLFTFQANPGKIAPIVLHIINNLKMQVRGPIAVFGRVANLGKRGSRANSVAGMQPHKRLRR